MASGKQCQCSINTELKSTETQYIQTVTCSPVNLRGARVQQIGYHVQRALAKIPYSHYLQHKFWRANAIAPALHWHVHACMSLWMSRWHHIYKYTYIHIPVSSSFSFASISCRICGGKFQMNKKTNRKLLCSSTLLKKSKMW